MDDKNFCQDLIKRFFENLFQNEKFKKQYFVVDLKTKKENMKITSINNEKITKKGKESRVN